MCYTPDEPTGPSERQLRLQEKTGILKVQEFDEGVRRIVHVKGSQIRDNLRRGSHAQTVVIARHDGKGEPVIGRFAKILGPSAVRYTPAEPVKGSNNSVICYIETTSKIELYQDADNVMDL